MNYPFKNCVLHGDEQHLLTEKLTCLQIWDSLPRTCVVHSPEVSACLWDCGGGGRSLWRLRERRWDVRAIGERLGMGMVFWYWTFSCSWGHFMIRLNSAPVTYSSVLHLWWRVVRHKPQLFIFSYTKKKGLLNRFILNCTAIVVQVVLIVGGPSITERKTTSNSSTSEKRKCLSQFSSWDFVL